jgi:hypothetical protein
MLIGSFLSATAAVKESVPAYSLGRPVFDKTLKSTESLFEITLTEQGSILKNTKIVFAYNGTEKKMSSDANGKVSFKVKSGKYKLQFYVKDYYEITTDSIKAQENCRVPMQLSFMSSTHPVMVEKPVIYIYAPEPTDVSVKLQPAAPFSFTYPAYNTGWNVQTGKSGMLGTKTKEFYPYLFWEAPLPMENAVNPKEGYLVSKQDLLKFLEGKLSDMGFNAKESADFITYWYPRMSAGEVCYIHFLFNKDIEKYAPMQVEPKPDNVFRMCMVWSPVPANAEVTKLKEQKIPAFSRNGLTVVEWGGTEIKMLNP